MLKKFKRKCEHDEERSRNYIYIFRSQPKIDTLICQKKIANFLL